MEQYICRPRVMWLSIVDYCNNRCLWCYEQCNEVLGRSMSLDLVKRICNAMRSVGVKKCIVIGGEPTLHPNFFEVLSEIKECGFTISLVTNGRLISKHEIAEKLSQTRPDFLTISIHGWSPESYCRLTKSKNGFSEVAEGMTLLRKHGVKFEVNITLSKLTAGLTEEILSFLEANNIKHAGFNLASPSVSAQKTVAEFVPTMQELASQAVSVFKGCLSRGIRPSFLLTLPFCLFGDEELSEFFKARAVISGCQLLSGSGIVFQADGSISLCNHLLDFKIANPQQTRELLASEGNFLEFWNAEKLCEIRKQANCFRSPVCSKCSQWGICGAGCMVRWAHHSLSEVEFREVNINI
ncbi:MAG: molybdenum cofactor biosynthesis enzyme [Parcubacteria group bacterium Licking1014_17]|nr:MAG: molybdenum cofactor biosynthesis enzyme [Parcubacteria group bacterium Licking1014_17]